MNAHTRSKRALLAGTFAKELLGAIVQIRGDRPLLHNLAGVLSLNGELREGFLQDEVWKDAEAPQSLIRAITDRERRVELGQYEIDPDLICVFVTHSSQDVIDLEMLIQEVVSNLPERHEVHWIHLLEEEGMKMEELRSLFDDIDGLQCHEIGTKTESESIHFVSKEWATVLLQVTEYLMLKSAQLDGVSRDEVQCYGVASIDFSRREGLRLLEAKAQLDVLNREENRIHLDRVYLQAFSALKKGKTAYARVKAKFIVPSNVESYFDGIASYSKFDANRKFDAFRSSILEPGGVIESLSQELEEELTEAKREIWNVLDDCSTSGQERLNVVNCLLGRPGTFVEGKAIRPTLMLEDCESDLLNDALSRMHHPPVAAAEGSAMVPEPLEISTVLTLHTQRRICDEVMDDIVNIERMLEVGAESKEELKSGKEMLAQRREDHRNAVHSSSMLRTKYGDFRRKLFAQFTSSWLEGEIAKLRKECVYPFIPPKKKEDTIFSVREKQLIKVSALICLPWLLLGLFLPFILWLTPAIVTSVTAAFWIALAMWRMRQKDDVVEDPMIKQRELWRKAVVELHEIHVEYALMQRFDKVFDEEIRKPLLTEANELQSIIECMHQQKASADAVVASCFTEVDFVEQLGNSDTFNQYYEEQVSPSLGELPSVVDSNKDVRRRLRKWSADRVVECYWMGLGNALKEHVSSMKEFEMLGYLLGKLKDQEPPVFVLRSNSDFDELVRRCRIHLELLHDDSTGSSLLVVMHDSRLEPYVLEEFKSKLDSIFEESKSNQLSFIATDDPNRVAFLRVGKVIRAKKKPAVRSKQSKSNSSSIQAVENQEEDLGLNSPESGPSEVDPSPN